MVCPNCGYSNQAQNRFCVRCGIDISAPTAPDTPSFDAAPPPGSAAPAAPNPWAAPPPPSTWAAPGQAPPPPPAAPYPGAPAPNPFAPPAPPPPYAPPGAYGQYPPPYPPSGFSPPTTNGLAIASLVLGIVGWVPCGIGSVLAVIFGFVARNQIRDSQGRQGGDGLAQAGIILGFVGIALVIGFFVLTAVLGTSESGV